MASQTFLTVAEAAVRVDKSRQTLFDKIKRGKLSATVNGDGIKVIDVSELLRVFGPLLSDDELRQNQANKSGQGYQSSMTSTLQLELELAKLRLTHTEKELESSNRQLEEMRVRERQSIEDRTQLLGVIERQTLMLAAPATAKPAARQKAAAVAKPKTPAKVKVASAAKNPTAARKTPTKAAAKKVVATTSKKPLAKSTRSNPAGAKKATKK